VIEKPNATKFDPSNASRNRTFSTGPNVLRTGCDRKLLQPANCGPEGFRVGYDGEKGLARGFTVSESGVVVIAKAESIELMLTGSI